LLHSSEEAAEKLNDLAQALANVVIYACRLLTTYHHEITEVVKKHFGEFRRNRAWLQLATTRAAEEVCRKIALAEGCYEDDLNEVVRFVIYRYPVEAVLMAANRKTVEEFKAGASFEGKCFELLVTAGYEVRRLGGSGDQGADLIATMNALSYAVQCKDYGESVGNAAVQQAVAARAYYRTDFAVVCASNGFTRSARSLAVATDTLLLPPELLFDLDRLRRLIG
jgi:restriction endonuclease Mrr